MLELPTRESIKKHLCYDFKAQDRAYSHGAYAFSLCEKKVKGIVANNVNQPWSKVLKELYNKVVPPVGHALVEEIERQVETRTWFDKGVVMHYNYHQVPEPIIGGKLGYFGLANYYVDPNGILKKNKYIPKKKEFNPPTVITLNGMTYVQANAVWYKVFFTKQQLALLESGVETKPNTVYYRYVWRTPSKYDSFANGKEIKRIYTKYIKQKNITTGILKQLYPWYITISPTVLAIGGKELKQVREYIKGLC